VFVGADEELTVDGVDVDVLSFKQPHNTVPMVIVKINNTAYNLLMRFHHNMLY
jgi:hypothetical protein